MIWLWVVLCLAACARKNIQTKEAAREAIVEHLGKVAGLDMTKMDVEITQMSFQETTAEVGVSIVPKAAPNDGMQMGYQLKREGDKWVVASKKGGAAAGHGGMPPAPPAGAMPPGHPPVPEKK